MRKPHNLKVLQSDTSKLKKQLKMLTVSLIKFIFSIHLVQFVYQLQAYLLFLFLKVFLILLFLKDPLNKKENYIIAVSIDKVYYFIF